jgi:hypothetical protein
MMRNRAYYAKDAINQYPRSKKDNQRSGGHNGMRKRDYSEDNCNDPPQNWNPPMTF